MTGRYLVTEKRLLLQKSLIRPLNPHLVIYHAMLEPRCAFADTFNRSTTLVRSLQSHRQSSEPSPPSPILQNMLVGWWFSIARLLRIPDVIPENGDTSSIGPSTGISEMEEVVPVAEGFELVALERRSSMG